MKIEDTVEIEVEKPVKLVEHAGNPESVTDDDPNIVDVTVVAPDSAKPTNMTIDEDSLKEHSENSPDCPARSIEASGTTADKEDETSDLDTEVPTVEC